MLVGVLGSFSSEKLKMDARVCIWFGDIFLLNFSRYFECVSQRLIFINRTFYFQSSCIFDIWLTFSGHSNPFYWRNLSQWQLLQSASQSSPMSVFMMGMRSMTEGLKGIQIWWVAGQAFIVTVWFLFFFSHRPVHKIQICGPWVYAHMSLSLIVHKPQLSCKTIKKEQIRWELVPKPQFGQFEIAGSNGSLHSFNTVYLNSFSAKGEEIGEGSKSNGFQNEIFYEVSSLCWGGPASLSGWKWMGM